MYGAGGGSRTHTDFHPRDFKSRASTIPPHQLVANCALARFQTSLKSIALSLVCSSSPKMTSIFVGPIKWVTDPRKLRSCSFSNKFEKYRLITCLLLFPKNDKHFRGSHKVGHRPSQTALLLVFKQV